MRDLKFGSLPVSRLRRRAGLVGAIALAAGLTVTSAFAQSLDVLADFGSPEGMQPFAGLIQGNDGAYYGTTAYGGTGYGTVYRLDNQGKLTVLAVFANTNGSRPEAGVVQGFDGNLYGTTRMGGTYNKGVVFRVNPLTRALTVLRNFNTTDGADPRGGLVQGDDGNFYGTTSLGGNACGTSTCGTIFRISPSGAFTSLFRFTSAKGAGPLASMIKGADGRFYGTTSMGGSYNRGTVFVIGSNGVLQTLHSFNLTEGYSPYGSLLQTADGYLWGTTYLGGALSKGAVYRLTTSGGLVNVHSFTGVDGSNPRSALVEGGDGALYGTASMGGASSKGTAFRLDRSSGVVTLLHAFATADGVTPYGALVQGPSGTLYGTASSAGPTGSAGTIYRLASTGSLTVVRAFLGSPVKPYSALAVGQDGRLMGTTYSGGGMNKGSVYSVDLNGVVQIVHAFNGGDGANPIGGVTFDTTTMVFGTASAGGASQSGTGYKMATTGAMQVVSSMTVAGGYSSFSRVVEAPDGNFYGTAYYGGSTSMGSIFRLTKAGVLTTVFSFNGAATGRNPYSGLTVGPGGVLYGTTLAGGATGIGALYSFDPASGAFQRLVSFSGANGSSPRAEVLYANDGMLYGTTGNGGASSQGTIFRFDPSTNKLTTVFSFNGTSGATPYGTLIQASDGLLYGTTYGGGAFSKGTVFQFNPATGALKTIATFSGANGASPHGGLVQAGDGRLYGATTAGGSVGNGVVYRITLN